MCVGYYMNQKVSDVFHTYVQRSLELNMSCVTISPLCADLKWDCKCV